MKRKHYMNRVLCLACGASWKERQNYAMGGTFTFCDRCEVIQDRAYRAKKSFNLLLIAEFKKTIKRIEKMEARERKEKAETANG